MNQDTGSQHEWPAANGPGICAQKPDGFAAITHSSLAGVVLAGGASARLGRDKALLRFPETAKHDLLERTGGLLQGLCSAVFVVGRQHPGLVCLEDGFPGCGPAGGIATALAHTRSACLVLSCDMPFMERPVIEDLIAHRQSLDASGVLCTAYRREETGRIEALVAIYEASGLPLFEASLSRGELKVSRIIPLNRQRHLFYSEQRSLAFFNVNTPEDLELARHMAAERESSV